MKAELQLLYVQYHPTFAMLCNAVLWYEAAVRLDGSEVKEGRGPKALQRAFEPTMSDLEELDENRGSRNSQHGICETDFVPTFGFQESSSPVGASVRQPSSVLGGGGGGGSKGRLHPTALQNSNLFPEGQLLQGCIWGWAQSSSHSLRLLLTFLPNLSVRDFPCCRRHKQVPRLGPMGQTWNPLQSVEAE